MELNKIILPIRFFNILSRHPKQKSDFMLVKATLKSGQILFDKRVYNSSILILDTNQSIRPDDIENIEVAE